MSASTLVASWQHAGLDCAVVLQPMGHHCGYVRVPAEHPWHGLSYDDLVPNPSDAWKERGADPETLPITPMIAVLFGSRDGLEEWGASLDGQVEVHGGLTYASDSLSAAVEVPDGWWLGFDCAHAGDTHEVWTAEATQRETERLAEKVAAAREG